MATECVKSPAPVTLASKENYVLSIISVLIKAQKGTNALTTYAFLDPGSTVTFAAAQHEWT